MDNRRLKKYVALIAAKKKAEGDQNEIKEKLKPLEDYIMENMINSGQQKVTIDGYTIYVQRQLWATAAISTQYLCDALRNNGYAQLVQDRVTANQLSALVREFDVDADCVRDENELRNLPGDLMLL